MLSMNWLDIAFRVVFALVSLGVAVFGFLTVVKNVRIHHLKLETRKLEETSQQVRFNQFNAGLLRALHVVHSLDDLTDSIFANTGVDRILMFEGVFPTPNMALVSIIYERHREDRFQLKHRYKRLPVDELYLQMLREAEINGFVEIDVDNMADSFLKDAYQSEGVTSSVVCYVGQVPTAEFDKNIMFFSFATYKKEKYQTRDVDYIKALFVPIVDVLKIYVKA